MGSREGGVHGTAQALTGGGSTVPRERRGETGHGLRLGLVLPSVNTVIEPWYNNMRPEGVAFHVTRMLLKETTPESLRLMSHDMGRATAELKSCGVHVIGDCCTALSIVNGPAYDEVVEELFAEHGLAGTTATQAVVGAFRAMGIRRVTVVSPYPPDIDDMEIAFLSHFGIETVSHSSFGIRDGFDLAKPDPDAIYEKVRETVAAGIDGVFLTCLNFRGHPIIQRVEDELGLPVVTSTQAMLWRMLRLAGVDETFEGFGALLREH